LTETIISTASTEVGLAAYQGKALLISVTGEEERPAHILPLGQKHGEAVVAICNDGSGISSDIDVPFNWQRRLCTPVAGY